MASDTAEATPDLDDASQVASTDPQTVYPVSLSQGEGDAFTMATAETARDAAEDSHQDEPQGVVSPQDVLPDEEWNIAKQCLSVFLIEVYQCKLCCSFNSTQRATLTNHLKEKHLTEWQILNDVSATSPLAGGSRENSISQGDLEEMVEKELTDGNQRRANAADVTTSVQGATGSSQESTVGESGRESQTTKDSASMVGRTNMAEAPVALPQTLVKPHSRRPKLVRLPVRKTQSTVGTNGLMPPAENRSKEPKALHPPSKSKGTSEPSARDRLDVTETDEVQSQSSASSTRPKTDQQKSLRPGLRQNAKRKPREFKDFVVSGTRKRRSAIQDEHNDDDDDEEGEDGEDEDDSDEDYVVPEDDNDSEDEGADKTSNPEKVSKDGPKKQSKQPRKAYVLKNRGLASQKFKCSTCLLQFGTETALRRHNSDNRCIGMPISSKEFPCNQCDYKANTPAGLKIHYHSHKQRQEKKFSCLSCKRMFTSAKGVRKHRRNRCPVLIKKKPKVPKVHPCDQCGKVCKEKKALRDHMACHSEIRSYRCNICPKAFKTPGSLKRHRKKHQDTFFYCDKCSFKTRWRSSLKTHNVAHHAQDTREFHQCPKCSYQTRNRFYLRRHIESHTDTREFICEICGKAAKTQIILNVHRETHANGHYPCSQCDYVGKTKMAIYSHRLVHIPKEQMTYKCEQCSWVGKRKSELRMHYRKHSSIKLFHCQGCGKSYKHKHALTRHLREKHIGKTMDLTTLEVEGMVHVPGVGQNAVLNSVQEMIDDTQLQLQVAHQAQPHCLNGISAIVQGAASGLNMQQYQIVQGSHVIEQVQGEQDDSAIPNQVVPNPNVAMTSLPVAQIFEIATTDVTGDSHMQVSQ